MTTTSLADVRARLSAYVDEVARTQARVTITRNGVPAAVLVSVDDLESLEETIDVLSDPTAMADIQKSLAELDGGELAAVEELREDLADRMRQERPHRPSAVS